MRFIRTMTTLLLLTGGALSFASLNGCGSDGGKCDTCDPDAEGECRDGRTCSLFSDGIARCAGPGEDECSSPL